MFLVWLKGTFKSPKNRIKWKPSVNNSFKLIVKTVINFLATINKYQF